jgi:hypothetical protein
MTEPFAAGNLDPELLAAARGEGLYGGGPRADEPATLPRVEVTQWVPAPAVHYSLQIVAWRLKVEAGWVYHDKPAEGAEPLYALLAESAVGDVDLVDAAPCELEDCENRWTSSAP